jgi:GntR family negative regulator for fad regulon and positive regulator of fabA
MLKAHISPPKPIDRTEAALVVAMLDGSLPPGQRLPNERDLSVHLGVTRPTLREALRRLAGEGWLTVQHGKSTVVNDHFQTGGLGLLATAARFPEYLPPSFVRGLLEVRVHLVPPMAAAAAEREAQLLGEMLASPEAGAAEPQVLARFDWALQLRMAQLSGNPVNRMIMNDFEPIFRLQACHYFKSEAARRLAYEYYMRLRQALEANDVWQVQEIVRWAMRESVRIWNESQID